MWEYLNVRTHLSQTRLVQWTSRNLIKHMVCWRKVVSWLSCAAKIHTRIRMKQIYSGIQEIFVRKTLSQQTYSTHHCAVETHTVHIPIKRARAPIHTHTHQTIYLYKFMCINKSDWERMWNKFAVRKMTRIVLSIVFSDHSVFLRDFFFLFCFVLHCARRYHRASWLREQHTFLFLCVHAKQHLLGLKTFTFFFFRKRVGEERERERASSVECKTQRSSERKKENEMNNEMLSIDLLIQLYILTLSVILLKLEETV